MEEPGSNQLGLKFHRSVNILSERR